MNNKTYFIGLMSGTSLDGIDVAIVDIKSVQNSKHHSIALIASQSVALPDSIKSQLIHLSFEQNVNMQTLGETGVQLAQLFAQSINALLASQGIDKSQIMAIGSHGLTIRHQPYGAFPFSLQITDPSLLAQLTGIDVVSDFRNMDIAVGGQGAPLVPAFHQALLGETSQGCIVLNLGGIANITVLNPGADVIGYDTGPANTLLDVWCEKHTLKAYDKNGIWASTGRVIPELLTLMLAEPYFAEAYPKSTGKELFNLDWLFNKIDEYQTISSTKLNKKLIPPEDIQRTLLELTVVSAALQIKQFTHTHTLFVCGGGVHNQCLVEQLQQQLPAHQIKATDEVGINSDALEAMAFAWLAYCRVHLISANSPSVTGAKSKVIMGSWYSAKSEKVS